MKTNNKSMFLSLKILAILAFALIFVPFRVSAQSCGDGGCNYVYGNPSSGSLNYNNSYYNSAPYQAPVYTAPTPASTPVVYSNSTNPNQSSGGSDVMTVTYTPTKSVATATKPKSSTVATADSATNPDTANSLAANAVYGSNSFLPSGLIQWILFAIFILLLIILARIMFGNKKQYHESPLKQE